MKRRFNPRLIFFVLLGYILMQFLWWEVVLVKQSNAIISEKEKLAALNHSNPESLQRELQTLHQLRVRQTLMFTGEGTVFLLLLIFGANYIRKAHERETAFNKQQENFFLSITHELKTPIAAMRLQIQTLQRKGLDESQRQALLSAAISENDRLNQLIDNVLMASRLESNAAQNHFELINWTDLVKQTVNRYFTQLLESKKIEINLMENIWVKGDAQTLTSVVINLIENAIKYSPSSKTVEVALHQTDHHAILLVKDQGLGISLTDKEKVFDRFYRSGDEATRMAKGTGLGLYIVKQIVLQHGGQVKIENNQPTGSVFHVQIPLHN